MKTAQLCTIGRLSTTLAKHRRMHHKGKQVKDTYNGPSILQPCMLRPRLPPPPPDYKTTRFGPKVQFYELRNLHFKTTCNIRPIFDGHMGGFK